jgi:hypothetical protein
MAGSATIISNKTDGMWRTIVWEWTSDADGDVSGVGDLSLPSGAINTILSVPKSGVSDGFDLVITGSILLDSGARVAVADLLNGVGAGLSNSTNGQVKNVDVTFPIPHNTKITPVISNAGNKQSGYLFLFVWQE